MASVAMLMCLVAMVCLPLLSYASPWGYLVQAYRAPEETTIDVMDIQLEGLLRNLFYMINSINCS